MKNNRILVIDDEPKVQEVYAEILAGSAVIRKQASLDKEAALLFGEKVQAAKSKEEFEVAFACQGEEGLELIKKAASENRPFALAFIDVRMPPGWDGVKTASEIRKGDPFIELVIVTAYADKSLDEIIENVGAPEKLLYIKKPFIRDEIWQLANALCSKWALQQQEKHHLEELDKRVKERTKDLEESNRKLKESQAQLVQSAKMAAMGQLSAGLAHEINNPLSSVLGYSEFIISKLESSQGAALVLDPQEIKKQLEIIRNETLRCKGILENILVFSTKSNLLFEPTPVTQAATKAVELLRHQLKLNNISVVWELPDEPIFVLGKINQLYQVFINLLLNALQAMPQGGEIKISAKLKNKDFVEIKVCDAGVGISKEDLPRVFEPFFTTKRIWTSVGLGLTICYQILQEHQGTIVVESDLGKGTTAILTLPLLKKE